MIANEVQINKDAIASCCERYGVSRLWIFGSMLKPNFRVDSDVDVLIDVPSPIGLFRLGGLEVELTELFGRPVHLTTLNSVPERIRQQLLTEARLEYGR